MNTFYNKMFNPQYVNLGYYRQIEYMQREVKQSEEIGKAVKAISDLCEAIKEIDDQHQEIAMAACLAEMSKQFNWR